MGMYDYLRCEHELPGGRMAVADFETKDFECSLATHVITKDGRLLLDFGRYEEVAEEDRPYKDDPNPLMRLCGSLKWIPNRVEQTKYSGGVSFYNEEDGWFVAVFLDGKLIAIRKGEHFEREATVINDSFKEGR